MICSNLLSIDTALRRLPCAGQCVVHESCGLSMFIEAQSEDNGSATVSCQYCGDGEVLFPSLKRCPRRRKPETPVAAEEVLTTNQASGDSVSGGFVLTGNVFGGISGAAVGATPNANAATVSGRPPRAASGQRHQVRRRPSRNSSSGSVSSADDLSQGLITSQSITTNTTATRRGDSAPSSLTASASADTLNSMNSMRSSMSGIMSRSARRHKSPVTLTRVRQQAGGRSLPTSGFGVTSTSYVSPDEVGGVEQVNSTFSASVVSRGLAGAGRGRQSQQQLPPSGFDITSTSYTSSGSAEPSNTSGTGRGRLQRGLGASARSRVNNSNNSNNSGSAIGDFSLGGAKLDTSGAGRNRITRRESERDRSDEENVVAVSDRELIVAVPSLRLATS